MYTSSRISLLLGVACSLSIALSSIAFAQARSRARLVTQQDIVAISVTDKSGKQLTLFCLGTESGRVSNKPTGLSFKSLAEELAALKKKAKTNPKLKTKMKKLKSLKVLADAQCRTIPPTNATPVPTSTPTLLPGQPTPTPDPRAMFDNQSNVTFLGKQYLGIPANLASNIDTGEAIWKSDCKGCHTSEPSLFRYPEVSARIQLDPMFLIIPDRVSQQSVAHIIAYFNRFKFSVP